MLKLTQLREFDSASEVIEKMEMFTSGLVRRIQFISEKYGTIMGHLSTLPSRMTEINRKQYLLRETIKNLYLNNRKFALTQVKPMLGLEDLPLPPFEERQVSLKVVAKPVLEKVIEEVATPVSHPSELTFSKKNSEVPNSQIFFPANNDTQPSGPPPQSTLISAILQQIEENEIEQPQLQQVSTLAPVLMRRVQSQFHNEEQPKPIITMMKSQKTHKGSWEDSPTKKTKNPLAEPIINERVSSPTTEVSHARKPPQTSTERFRKTQVSITSRVEPLSRGEIVKVSRQQFKEIAEQLLHNEPAEEPFMASGYDELPLPGQPVEEEPSSVNRFAASASQLPTGSRDSKMRPLVLATSARYREEMAKMMGLPTKK